MSFELISWNVNGIRSAIKKGFIDWLTQQSADVIALQEVRATEAQLPKQLLSLDDWQLSVNAAERKGYSGVGLFTKNVPDHLQTDLGEPEFDCEGRLQIARFGQLLVVNGYFPNGSGKNRDNGRVDYKLRFYQSLFQRLQAEFDQGVPILVVGDFNTAHKEIDLARPKSNLKTSGFLLEEREELDRWMHAGWVDTFREFQPEGGHYTWWSQRFGVREKNIGWRIDYVLASPGAMPYLINSDIHPHIKGSDHCPISVRLDRAVLG